MPNTVSDDDLNVLKNEIKMAEAINKEELEPILVEGLKRYIGSYTPPMGMGWDILLNEVYPIVQNNLPSTFFRNPRAFLKPRSKSFITKKRDPVSGKMVEQEADSSKSAKTQEAILNYYIGYKMKYKPECRKTLLDALIFPYGVMWHGYKGDFGMTEEKSLYIKKDSIFVKRLNPMRFLKDPFVNIANIEEAKWVARIIDVPLQDILDDDLLSVDKGRLKGKPGFGDKIGSASMDTSLQSGGGDFLQASRYMRSLIEYADKNYKDHKGARFVRVYEIFKRPSKKDARLGKKGQIILLTNEQPKPLRVNEWLIKAEGFPAKIMEFNQLPDSQFGISDISTYRDIIDQKNAIVNLQIRNAQENSKVWVAIAKGEMGQEEDVQRIKNGNQTIVLFDGESIAGKMSVMSAAGAGSTELPTMYSMVDKNLQDKSMMSDLKKGFLQSGEESAASVKIRNAGGSARPAYRQDMMKDFLTDSFTYTLELLKQFVSPDEAVRIVGSLDVEWSDNPDEEDLQAETDIELDAISMLPEDPDKEIQELQTVLQLMVEGLTQPQIAQKIAQEGMTINLTPIIEQMLLRLKIRNPDVFRHIKPEESMGFASIQQLKAAQANVEAAAHGQPVQPPQPTDDHNAQLGVLQPIVQLLQEAGQQNTHMFQVLMQLIQVHQALLQQQQEQNDGNVGQSIKPRKPFMVNA